MVKILKLIWDEWNELHIARHNVTPEEVIEVCYGNHITVKGKKGRLMLIGSTKTGRILAVILHEKFEKYTYYVVTARQAGKKERMLYTRIYE